MHQAFLAFGSRILLTLLSMLRNSSDLFNGLSAFCFDSQSHVHSSCKLVQPPSSTTVQTILRSPITYCSSFLVAFVRPSHNLSLMKAQTSQFVQTLSFSYSRGAAISTALPHLRFAGSSSEEEGQCVRGTMSGTSAYTQCEHYNRPCL